MIGYLLNSGYHQSKILLQREPIENVLKDPETTDEVKAKLRLALEARKFAETELGLKATKNYQTYVKLGRPYVSYIVRVAPVFELKPYLWKFPLVGALPYKGYFSKEEAEDEAKAFDAKKYDTYVRGATAYSTLGWFNDPILSSMIRYSDHNLVNLIIHETVHATLFIEGNADFNERLATFIGDKGEELFFLKKEGAESPTLKKIALEHHDRELFSDFISKELKDLETWYKDNQSNPDLEKKKERIAAIQVRFSKEILPQMKTKTFSGFAERQLNNANLLSYKTYIEDLSEFEKLYQFFDRDIKEVIKFSKSLENVKDPMAQLKKQTSAQYDSI